MNSGKAMFYFVEPQSALIEIKLQVWEAFLVSLFSK